MVSLLRAHVRDSDMHMMLTRCTWHDEEAEQGNRDGDDPVDDEEPYPY